MKRKDLNNLVRISYKNSALDKKTVLLIGNKLSRKNLKLYLQALKNYEKKNTVKVIVADDKINRILLEKKLKQEFGNKKFDFEVDKSLIAGIKVIDNDLIYDYNLNSTINSLITHINN